VGRRTGGESLFKPSPPFSLFSHTFCAVLSQILALSRAFNIPIHVIQVGPPTIVAHSPDPDAKGALKPKEAKEIRACKITFHTRMYGLGAHYNSRT